MHRSLKRLVVATIATAAMCWSTLAEAEPDLEEGLAGIVTATGHIILMPAYCSLIYYAEHSEKRMGGGWVAANVITSAVAGFFGTGLIWEAADGSKKYQGLYLGGGISVLTGIAVVAIGTGVQRSRKNSSVWDSTSAMVVPYASSTASSGTNVGLMAVGQF